MAARELESERVCDQSFSYDGRHQDYVPRSRPVNGRTPKFVLDTQLFITAFHDPAFNRALQQFHADFAPFEYLSVVVAQELRAGAKKASERSALERNVFSMFDRSGRTITPSPAAWHRSADALAALAKHEGLELARVSKAFGNDILLAASCREAGCVLIIENVRDFSRIRRFLAFDFVAPWP
jgi:predicted nucleic acid-binding protein